jgi:hypothetical protein
MVKYLKTERGLFLQIKKNGKKNKTRKNKTRKNKKMIGGGGEPIEPGDIMYEDNFVRILNPHVKKGIIVWTNFKQPAKMDSLCESGLKTGRQLTKEGINFGKTNIHPYIFFRAPFYSRPIDYTSVEKEISSSYGERQMGIKSRVFIRVDPDKTFVFSSEIRNTNKHREFYMIDDVAIFKSRKTLSEYLQIISNNSKISKTVKPGEKIWYNLYTSEAEIFPSAEKLYNDEYDETVYDDDAVKILYDDLPIETNSEILVSIPHLMPNYFVLCTG